MANLNRTFVKGKMNKALNERLTPSGEYLDATNIRINSSEGSEGGVLENTKGNDKLTDITIDNVAPTAAVCIGSFEDGANETIYWFVTADYNSVHTSNKADFILSYNMLTDVMTYHVISMQDPNDADKTVLNFSEQHRINGVNLIEDMLYFTDGYNPPRKINVKRNYPRPLFASSYADTVSADEYNVIKRPPMSAPTVTGIASQDSNDDFMKDKFICFAYRYKYQDGEYSATSQFSEPVFKPEDFGLEFSTMLNAGVNNTYNSAAVQFETGDHTVIGIDILYKEMGENIIKIADKIDKATDGVANDATNVYIFDDSKVFTILPDSEILRLYDNVPKTAKAQTIMSNRLVYGNYTEGYDLKDSNDNNIRLDYHTYLGSNAISFESAPTHIAVGVDYGNSQNDDTAFYVDLTGVDLIEGHVLDFDISYEGGSVFGSSGISVDSPQQFSFSYALPQTFNNVSELFASQDFKNKVGTLSTIKPVYHATDDTSCDGNTFTDAFFCSIPATNGSKTKYNSWSGSFGTPVFLNAGSEAIETADAGIFNGNTEVVRIELPTMSYASNPASPSSFSFQSFDITNVDVSVSSNAGGESLKSNRSYEVGIVYMDDYGRSTTALVSRDNNVRIDISRSDLQNSINVEIPTTQKAPAWASKYKFVIKEDKSDYDTVYSSTYYKDSNSRYSYIMLEGENAAKVEEGDILIVKTDQGGAVNTVKEISILEKKGQEAGFITTVNGDGQEITPYGGVYAKVDASEISLPQDGSAIIDIPFIGDNATSGGDIEEQFPRAEIGPFLDEEGNELPMQAGARAKMEFEFSRLGSGDGNNSCERRLYTLILDVTAQTDYANFREFWIGEGIGSLLNQGIQDVGAGGDDIQNSDFFPEAILTFDEFQGTAGTTLDLEGSTNTNKFAFFTKSNGFTYLGVTGARACGISQSKQSKIKGSFVIIPKSDTIAFETKSADALADIWYENEQSFDIANGLHLGNVQSQTANDSAIIATSFFNCYSYGNGVESYKINDSIIGNKLKFGNRVTSTQAQEYKEAHRFADLTYSGVFNDESNINRLNEFNGGLLNFKACEDLYGPIEVIDARRTDILVLQEDKISTVLAGKNLLSMSDSVQGGALASVPEVLGQQLARHEEFGISNNPESYASYGGIKYFTDVKRGAVLKLAGEQLAPISNAGMGDFFRAQFIEDSTTQKLGGYDPYMKEYVISNIGTEQAGSSTSIECGNTLSLSLEADEVFTLTVSYDNLIGVIDNTVTSTGNATIVSNYDGTQQATGISTGINSLAQINKDDADISTVTYTITAGGSETTIVIESGCVSTPSLDVIQVVITDNGNDKKSTLAEYYVNGTAEDSPLVSQWTEFLEDESVDNVVSKYVSYTGQVGSGSIPDAGNTVYVQVRENNLTTFEFDAAANNRLLALKTSTNLTDSEADIDTMLSSATEITNVTQLATAPNGDEVWQGSFTLSDTPSDDKLYLIYDLRTYNNAMLSFGSTLEDSCCNQICGSGSGNYSVINGTSGSISVTYTPVGGSPTTVVLGANQNATYISEVEPTTSILSSRITVTLISCN